jgi:hypothetical protein
MPDSIVIAVRPGKLSRSGAAGGAKVPELASCAWTGRRLEVPCALVPASLWLTGTPLMAHGRREARTASVGSTARRCTDWQS